MGLDFARSWRVDVHTAVHRHGPHLAVDAVGGDAAVDGPQIERHRSGHAKVIVDARFVAEAEEIEMMLVTTSDHERVAGDLSAKVALVILLVPGCQTASHGRVHGDLV